MNFYRYFLVVQAFESNLNVLQVEPGLNEQTLVEILNQIQALYNNIKLNVEPNQIQILFIDLCRISFKSIKLTSFLLNIVIWSFHSIKIQA